MNSKSILAGTSLMFGRSVIILGEKGTGVYQCAWEALKFMDPVGTITINMGEMNYLSIITAQEGQLAPDARDLIKIDRLIKSQSEMVICVHGLESMRPHWLMYFLQQWVEGRKIIMIGEYCDYLPLIDRFEVVRM